VYLGLSLLSILTPLSLRRPYSQVPLTSEQSDTIVTLDSILPRLIWTAGSCILRDAIGPAALTNIAFQSNISLGNILSNVTIVSDCSLVNGTCEYGLLNDKGVRIDSKNSFPD
jgi:hypothetical protein